MLLLTKAVFAIMIGFLSSVVLGLILIPALKKMHIGQKISVFVGDAHRKKEGTPTMGGLIFIIPTIAATLYLILSERISKYLDSEESVEALKWFNEENIMYDLYYTYEMNSRYYVRNFAVETFINGKDFDTEYSKIESLLENDLKYYLT